MSGARCTVRASPASEEQLCDLQRFQIIALVCVLGLSISPAARQSQNPAPVNKSQRLETLAWPEAETILTPETVVVVPLGAASKEHGPHLKLRNDLALADYLTQRVVDATTVVVAPTLTYHFYPAFLEYPGSTSLSLATARDMTAEVVRTLSAYGPRRFYVLNTGVSTEPRPRSSGGAARVRRRADALHEPERRTSTGPPRASPNRRAAHTPTRSRRR